MTEDPRRAQLAALPEAIRSPLAPFAGAKPPAPAWFEAALADAPERRMIMVEGVNIELLTWGEVGKPGLLLLHGNGAHADWWAFTAPVLAKDDRVAAISWSGMGTSGWRETYTGEIFAKEIFAAVEAAELEADGQRPLIIGHSFGGFPLMYCATHFPEKIRGAVLLDSSVQPPEKRWKGPPPRNPMQQVYPTLNQALARFRLAPPQGCDNLYIADYIARTSLKPVALEDGSGEGWSWKFDPQMWGRFAIGDLGDLLEQMACPIALMWGERSNLMGQETMDYMFAKVPAGFKRVAIPDADHHVMIDQPLAFVAAVRGLLASWPL
jgi:pimeloyl-ACP methyl ester carboxylesterase